MPKDLIVHLTDKQIKFCEEYIKDHDSIRSLRSAGYAENGIYVTATRLLKNPNILDYIEWLKKKAQQRLKITPEMVLKEMYLLATVDLSKAYGEDGQLLPIKDMPKELRKAISSVDVFKSYIDGDAVGETAKVRFYDKTKALDMLAKHLALYKDSTQHHVVESYSDYLKRIAEQETKEIIDGKVVEDGN